MIRYKRPAFSATEEIFVNKFIRPLGTKTDKFGNLMKSIGDHPNTLWSCHTDTVHWTEGLQKVIHNDDTVALPESSHSNCLGADCTAGVWLMTEMIKAKVPGLYVFHRDEENGGGGSMHIASKTPDLLKDIDAAIAFDRFGTKSVITHQFGRCCSDDFADSLCEQLPGSEKDDSGLFTDTANYVDHVSECTNISVGYAGHHSHKEVQNLKFLNDLKNRMIKLDTSKLRFSRDLKDTGYPRYKPQFAASRFDDWVSKTRTLEDLIRANPGAVADLFEMYGLTAGDLEEHIHGSH
ncbi:hypothetical protein [Mesorhizobium sp. STM 4661]|uniref:hypothetical protein n=1 Tax=Mesorhizobium sp. STM 4661 TaxID=1297570 RepID=UPI00039A31D4|nr:hypothetical protein [Mesorhizobium sp. STM 4661]